MEDIKRLEFVNSRDIAPLFDNLLANGSAMGFDFLSFWGIEGNEATVQETGCPCFAASWPDEFAQRYVAQAYHQIDPLVYLAPASDAAINWNTIKGLNSELFGEAAAFGLRDGITIPIHVGQRIYLLSFATSRGIAVRRDEQSTLESMSFRFLQDYMRAERNAGANTREETDAKIVPMAMAGYTKDAIADFLGVTEQYVSASLRDALGKPDHGPAYGKPGRSSRMINIPVHSMPAVLEQ